MLKFCELEGAVQKFAFHHVKNRGETHTKLTTMDANFTLWQRRIEWMMRHFFTTISHKTFLTDILGEYLLSSGAIGQLWPSWHHISKSSLFCQIDDGSQFLCWHRF